VASRFVGLLDRSREEVASGNYEGIGYRSNLALVYGRSLDRVLLPGLALSSVSTA